MRDLEDIRDDLSAVNSILDDLPPGDDPYAMAALERRQYEAERVNLSRELEAADVPELDVVLDGTAVYGQTVRVEFLAKLLGRLQSAVSAIGQALQGPTTTVGAIAGDVLSASQLRFAATFPGSFGARLL